MAKNFIHTGKRGRPAIILNYPKSGTFTVNDLVAMNPHVKCRLSVYNVLDKMTRGKNRTIRYTGKTIKVGATAENPNGVGKPLWELQSMESYRRSQASKASAKTRKLANVTVDLTPAAQPVAA